MNDWNEGYFTSDTYTYGYYRELSPTYQNFVLLLKGFAAPEINEKSNHCELGFGQGISVNIHAASTPGIYYGTDFNPAQAAHANELCEASGCDAHLFDDSFKQMLERDDLPQFDSISLHGIWSWISTENQNIIVEFARKFLKSGGIFYNSYNSFPGWIAKAPLRELFILYDKFVGETENNTYNRVDGAMKFAEDLIAVGPLYVQSVTGIENILKDMKKDNHNYLAHEFFNRDWICMYFTEVAEILSNAKLEFACSAIPIEIIDKANLTPSSIEFLNKIKNPIMREQSRDYFINRQFRKDYFVRGARKLSQAERRNRLLNMKFVLTSSEDIDMKCSTALGEVGFNNTNFEKVKEYLISDNYSPKKFADLLERDHNITFENVEQIITVLSTNSKILPCQDEQVIDKVKSKCDKLNNFICKRAETYGNLTTIASPVIGGGITMGRFDQIFLRYHKRGINNSEELATFAWNIIKSQGQHLVKEGKPLESIDDNIKEFKLMAKTFQDKKLPILKALQIA